MTHRVVQNKKEKIEGGGNMKQVCVRGKKWIAVVLLVCFLNELNSATSELTDPIAILYPRMPAEGEEIRLDEFLITKSLEFIQKPHYTIWTDPSGKMSKTLNETRFRCGIWTSIFEPFHSPIAGRVPGTLEEALQTPFSLFQIQGIRPYPYPIPQAKTNEELFHFIQREFREKARPGDVAILPDSREPPIHSHIVLCRGEDTDFKPVVGIPIDRLDDSWYVSIGGWQPKTQQELFNYYYWSGIYYQVAIASAYYYFLHGALPTRPEQLVELVGPENPKAWNPVVRKFVQEVLKNGINIRIHPDYLKPSAQ